MNDIKNDNAFIAKHTALVHSIAARFKGRGIEYEELYSAGLLGLCKAGNNFDFSRGIRFSTYAVPVIMGEIKQLFRDGGTVKISRGLKELSLKATRIKEELEKSGNPARISDISKALGISEEDTSLALSAGQAPLSLNAENEDGEFIIDIPVPPPQQSLCDKIALRQILSRLQSDDRRLIYLRYFEDCTQSETAKRLNMTQVQVSRREKKILLMMRKELME